MANGLQAQFDEFMLTPGTSAADVQAAERWLRFTTADEERKVNNWMAERRAQNAAKRKVLLDRISNLQEELADIKRDAEQGLRPVPELLKARRLARATSPQPRRRLRGAVQHRGAHRGHRR